MDEIFIFATESVVCSVRERFSFVVCLGLCPSVSFQVSVASVPPPVLVQVFLKTDTQREKRLERLQSSIEEEGERTGTSQCGRGGW